MNKLLNENEQITYLLRKSRRASKWAMAAAIASVLLSLVSLTYPLWRHLV
jgi:hypothetical protein